LTTARKENAVSGSREQFVHIPKSFLASDRSELANERGSFCITKPVCARDDICPDDHITQSSASRARMAAPLPRYRLSVPATTGAVITAYATSEQTGYSVGTFEFSADQRTRISWITNRTRSSATAEIARVGDFFSLLTLTFLLVVIP